MLENEAGTHALLSSRLDHKRYVFEGFCLGFLESICVWLREARRRPELISRELIAVETERSNLCISHLDSNIEILMSGFHLSAIATACALDLAMKRVGLVNGDQHMDLRNWLSEVNCRHSMLATKPLPVQVRT